jgi:NTE family protein
MPDKVEEAHEPSRVGSAVSKATRTVMTPLAPAALAATTRAGRFARAAALRAAPRPARTLGGLGGRIEELASTFDGRLRIAAVDRARGRRVIFGEPDAPKASVAEAVLASCSVPWMFAPVEIDGREYVDGGVWSLTNLDAAPAGRGARVLALIPTAGVSLAPLRAASAAGIAYESAVLRARGVELETIVPDAASLKAIGRDLMDDSRRAAVTATGYAQGRQLV